MNIHPEDPRWTAYVLGELDDAERAEIERELESSADARELVDEIRMTTMFLKEELTRETPAALSIAQKQIVRAAAFAADGNKTVRWWTPRWALIGFAAGAVAATLILMVAVPSLLRSPQQSIPGVPVAASRQADQSLPDVSAPAPVQEAAIAREKQASRDSSSESPLAPQGQPGQQGQLGQQLQLGLNASKEERDEIAPAKARENDTKDAVADSERQTRVLNEVAGGLPAPSAAALPAPPTPPPAASPAPVSSNLPTRLDDREPKRSMSMIAVLPLESSKLATAGARGGARVGNMTAPGVPSPAAADKARLDVNRKTDFNTEAYDRIEDNPFRAVAENPLATFSIDVDTAAYANMRRFLNQNQLPPRDSVRIEEFINYFAYDYAQPDGAHPIAVHTDAAAAPWNPEHRLVRIGIKAKDVNLNNRPKSNLVFLLDVSNSMDSPEKLPLLKNGLKLLVDQLGENDRVAIVVYASRSGLYLPSTTGDQKGRIIQALDRLEAGGSTNGGSGIQIAYDTAVAGFIKGGVNRVILCTDGDFNVGVTSQGDLTRLIEDKAKSGVFLSVLGFGTGNLKDSTMEKLADQGNGNYAYIDSLNEARKVLVEEMSGTLMTVAKDVKIQIDFNPAQVNAYRLIGYENRVLRNEDFNNDNKDAGDMGAGHTVTALFEIVPQGTGIGVPGVDPSKYQERAATVDRRTASSEWLTVRVRYKKPDADASTRLDVPLAGCSSRTCSFDSASADFRFAAAVAEFGMILRESPHKGSGSLDHVIAVTERSKGSDRNGYREEFLRLVRKARTLKNRQ